MTFIESLMLWLLAVTGQPGVSNPGGGISTPMPDRDPVVQQVEKDNSNDEDDPPPFSSVIKIDLTSKKISNGL